jgi:hypothetical protein
VFKEQMISLYRTRKFSAYELVRASTNKPTLNLTEEVLRAARTFSEMNFENDVATPEMNPGEPPSKKSVMKERVARKGVPNFFFGVRLLSPPFYDRISAIQSEIVSNAPQLRKCLTSPKKLHLTCFVLELPCNEDVQAAIDSFQNCETAILGTLRDVAPPNRILRFNSLSAFGKNVLFAAPIEDNVVHALQEVTSILSNCLMERGLYQEKSPVKKWTPHATIAKTSADRKNGRKLSILKKDYESCRNKFDDGDNLVAVQLTTLDLLSMTEMDADGYYKSYAQISLI